MFEMWTMKSPSAFALDFDKCNSVLILHCVKCRSIYYFIHYHTDTFAHHDYNLFYLTVSVRILSITLSLDPSCHEFLVIHRQNDWCCKYLRPFLALVFRQKYLYALWTALKAANHFSFSLLVLMFSWWFCRIKYAKYIMY